MRNMHRKQTSTQPCIRQHPTAASPPPDMLQAASQASQAATHAGIQQRLSSPMERMLWLFSRMPDCSHSLKDANALVPPQVYTRPSAAQMQRTGP